MIATRTLAAAEIAIRAHVVVTIPRSHVRFSLGLRFGLQPRVQLRLCLVLLRFPANPIHPL